MSCHTIGDVTVQRVTEQCGAGFAPHVLFPAWDPRALDEHRALMIPDCFDVTEGRFIASVHTWVLRTPHHTILIDS